MIINGLPLNLNDINNIRNDQTQSTTINVTSFQYWLDLHKRCPLGTEFYPPTEAEGESEPGMQKDFYMIFLPGFPPDLKQKLISMFHDQRIDRQNFIDMYSQTFAPIFPIGTVGSWDSSWKNLLTNIIKDTEALAKACNPECARNMRALDVLRQQTLL